MSAVVALRPRDGGPGTQATGMSAVVALRPWRSWDTGNRDVSSGGSMTLVVPGHR